jgi:FMN phosphatase YigB (HAD superfamily)
MVGDLYPKDVLAANAAGIFGVWFNERSAQAISHSHCVTIHSMQALLAFFRSLDQ